MCFFSTIPRLEVRSVKRRIQQFGRGDRQLFQRGAEYAASRGIIIADTKFEWGVRDGKIILVDEVLTPDSSRFWPADDYEVGRSQKSFDKQFVGDHRFGETC